MTPPAPHPPGGARSTVRSTWAPALAALATFLLLLAAAGVWWPEPQNPASAPAGPPAPPAPPPGTATAGYWLPSAEEAWLEDLSRRSFRYFLEQADETTGLVLDRARTDGSPHDDAHRSVASIAATGFGLTALCIAAERGWIPHAEALERAGRSLRFLAEEMPHERGWFFHFVDWRTGARAWTSELSSIDTVLLLAGVLTVKQCFATDPAIVRDADIIYRRIDFSWMLDGDEHLLSMGWDPARGFLESRWDRYAELLLLYLVAIGSPTHPIPAASWRAWSRPWVAYGDYRYVSGAAPLFIHQFSHAWVDLRGRREREAPHIDWWENSVTATRAHRQFCLDLATEFPSYEEHLWGVTSSDSAGGYVGWGGPPREGPIDGTLVPAAAAGSLMLAPDIALSALRTMKARFGDQAYGRYGFADAFNPATGWVNPDVVGIDVGITLLSAENLRSGAVWRWFMANPEIARAMDAVGLEPVPPSIP